MGVTKLKPSRTPRLLDQWAEEKEAVRKDAARDSQIAIEQSKKLVAQSKEIQAKFERMEKKITRARPVICESKSHHR